MIVVYLKFDFSGLPYFYLLDLATLLGVGGWGQQVPGGQILEIRRILGSSTHGEYQAEGADWLLAQE